jgi:hypothetical protein
MGVTGKSRCFASDTKRLAVECDNNVRSCVAGALKETVDATDIQGRNLVKVERV